MGFQFFGKKYLIGSSKYLKKCVTRWVQTQSLTYNQERCFSLNQRHSVLLSTFFCTSCHPSASSPPCLNLKSFLILGQIYWKPFKLTPEPVYLKSHKIAHNSGWTYSHYDTSLWTCSPWGLGALPRAWNNRPLTLRWLPWLLSEISGYVPLKSKRNTRSPFRAVELRSQRPWPCLLAFICH